MPKVNGEKFKYTKKGIAAAKRAAKASGQKVVTKRKPKKRNEYV